MKSKKIKVGGGLCPPPSPTYPRYKIAYFLKKAQIFERKKNLVKKNKTESLLES